MCTTQTYSNLKHKQLVELDSVATANKICMHCLPTLFSWQEDTLNDNSSCSSMPYWYHTPI